MINEQDNLTVLRKINNKPKSSQRSLAKETGFSLGKLNYCLMRLKDKGLLKIKNFSRKKDKVKYMQYVLTPKGIAFRTKLTIEFMKRKMHEYEELKQDLESNKKKQKNFNHNNLK
tara:strand:+ start:1605 stop:1949 length:345 start_codon:yes stop_codon:yes gene_type:complete